MDRAPQWQLGVLVAVSVGSLVMLGGGCRRREPLRHDAASHVRAKTPPKVDVRLISANTAFGFKLLQKLVAEKPKENVFISPVSVALALAMTYNGAAGETKTAMAQTMGVQALSLAELNAANAALTKGLQDPEDEMDLAIANSIWVDQGFPVKPEFLTVNRTSYSAEVANVPLGASESVERINAWVSEKTKGKITGIVTPEDFKETLVLIVLNAAYFRAKWTEPFKSYLTHDGLFTPPDGKGLPVQMMARTDRMAYLEGEGFQAVRLDYGSGRFNMVVLLPAKKSSLKAFGEGITPEKWDAWVGGLADREGTLKLPRFRVEGEFGLKEPLTALGMGIAFEERRADFSEMVSGGGVWIGHAKHKTYVDVNEEGTEAAAVTAMPMMGGMPPPSPPGPPPFEMIVDRPFLCAICDSATGTILFMGAIVDPKA